MSNDIADIKAAVERLRKEQTALTAASDVLLDWGIYSHTAEVKDRLDELSAEAVRLARRLLDLGAIKECLDASGAWLNRPRRRQHLNGGRS